MKIIRVIIYDHSCLGGPMGTEKDPPVIKSKIFLEMAKATLWAYRQANKYCSDFEKLSTTKLNDLGPIGIEFKREEAR